MEVQLFHKIGQYLHHKNPDFLDLALTKIESAEDEWNLCDIAKKLYLLMAREGLVNNIEIPYLRICDHCRQNDTSIPKHPETITALEQMRQENYVGAVLRAFSHNCPCFFGIDFCIDFRLHF